MVGVETSVCSACMAARTMRSESSLSLSGERFGSPQTCSTRTPRTMRLACAALGIIASALIMAVVMPLRSSSLVIVAPQRLQLPQVATSSAAFTPAALNSSAICSPIRLALVTGVPLPTVEKKYGYTPPISPLRSMPLSTGSGST